MAARRRDAIFKGFIDCLYCDAAGQWRVIDYKTNRGQRGDSITPCQAGIQRPQYTSVQCTTPEEQRRFAAEVVRRLRGAGFEAYWAGGCVRDQLLGRTPKDYDVATNAVPEQVRALFGRRRTLAIGAAFGVIAVIGPKAAGTVEVTTFRRDAPTATAAIPTASPSAPPRRTPRAATSPSTACSTIRWNSG
jgi:hypothetical protein